jgi:hypothetical protein
MPHDLLMDIQLAWRGLWRSRGFTGAAVAVLGVGIAGATAILALLHGVLLRPLPVRDQQRLIVAWKDLKASGYQHYPFGDRAISSVGERSRLLERVAGVTTNGVSQWVAVDDTAVSYIKGALVTGSFFGSWCFWRRQRRGTSINHVTNNSCQDLSNHSNTCPA